MQKLLLILPVVYLLIGCDASSTSGSTLDPNRADSVKMQEQNFMEACNGKNLNVLTKGSTNYGSKVKELNKICETEINQNFGYTWAEVMKLRTGGN